MKFGLTSEELDSILAIFKQFPEIQEATLFGSRAMGREKQGSDIDIALKGTQLDSVAAAVSFELNNGYLPYYFDVLNYASIDNEVLKSHIDRVGVLIYSPPLTKSKKPSFHFAPALVSQKSLIHHWLAQEHISKWIHGMGLQSTLHGLENFFLGLSDTTYWVGYDQGTPFAFLITSFEGLDAITLDLFICDLNYLGKGFCVPMIHKFLKTHFPHIRRALIDPEKTNTRAVHVYQKAGFKIIGEFIASWHPVPHYQMELRMEEVFPEGMISPYASNN